MRSVLLVDSNQYDRERLAAVIRKEIGCIVLEATQPEEAMDSLEKEEVGLLITDLFLPQKEGVNLLKRVHKTNPQVVTMAAIPHEDRQTILEMLQLGVFFYINTPYDFQEAMITVARGLHYYDLAVHREFRGLKIRKSDGFNGMIGKSVEMQNLFGIISRVAEDSSSTVLIQGESGTGKELVARAVHAYSPRRGKNFVPVNCAAIPDELLESELFGYVKGAFTGATQSKMGRIQYADGGTLFLDEIGDMKPSLQAKLLRVLQEKEFEPVGGVKPVPVDVRVVAATHRDLEKGVEEGRFREDLYYRLSVVPIEIPPLRQRKDDIPLLIQKFVQIFNRSKRVPLEGFAADAMAALMEYPWPGNVRELENLVQRMVILCGGKVAALTDLPDKYAMANSSAPSLEVEETSAGATPEAQPLWSPDGVDFNAVVSDFEDRLILRALKQTGGNKKEAAKLLNLKRTTLIEKIKKKNLEETLSGVQ
jgi:DNA-binding NtrC family response regulator